MTTPNFILATIIMLFSLSFVWGQDQRIADSLSIIYQDGTIDGEERRNLLRMLAFNESRNHEQALGYAEELIDLSSAANDLFNLFRGYREIGETHLRLGNFDVALEAYFNGLAAATKAENKTWEGSILTGIADTYSEMGNSSNASKFYNQAISMLRETDDTLKVGIAIINAGDEYFQAQKYDSALIYFEESAHIFEQQDYLIGKAYAQGNLGMVYAATGNYEMAKENISEAVAILETFEDSYAISEYLTYMADSHWEQGDVEAALHYAHRSLEMARQFGIKQQISDSNLKLADFYEKLGQLPESLQHFKEHVAYRDSVNNLEAIQRMADLEMDFEVSKKQVEIDLVNQQKRNQQIVLGSLGALAVVLLWFYLAIRREKKKSDDLLLNILPEEIAKELKEKGQVESVRFENVSVLFTDFVQFSKIAAEADPKQLIKSLDYYFRKFDAITAKYGLEKIKTIGDAYMCACGLPTPDPEHVQKTVKAALEMIEIVQASLKNNNGLKRFQLRVGIHTGPVIAGLVGTKKFQYDIWGDTVNIAARMESSSQPGRINISENTYDLIKDDISCTYRGEIDVKNRGKLKMYYLN